MIKKVTEENFNAYHIKWPELGDSFDAWFPMNRSYSHILLKETWQFLKAQSHLLEKATIHSKYG